MEAFFGIVIFYVFAALIGWMIAMQVSINDIKKKLKNNNYQQPFVQRTPPKEVITKEVTVQEIKPENKNILDEIVEVEKPVEYELHENFEPVKTASVQKEEEQQPIKKPEEYKSDFEKAFMGKIFHIIGAVALLIGLCIFIKIISPYIIFTDEMKLATGFISGFAMLFGALKIQKDEKMKKFSEVLMGTGFGAILITIYCGAGFMEKFSTPVALTMATFITFLMYFIADKQKTTSMIVLSLIGGYLNPFFTNYNISTDFLFFYLLFLNILSIVFVLRNKDKSVINIVNLALTTFCIMICSSFTNLYTIQEILILWGLYIFYDIFSKNNENDKIQNALQYLNFAVLLVLAYPLYFKDMMAFGTFIAIVSAVYFAVGLFYLLERGKKDNGYFYSCIIGVFFSTLFLTDAESLMRVLFWSLEALIIGFISLKYENKKMLGFASGFLTFAIMKMFISSDIYSPNYKYPILNTRTLYFLYPVFSSAGLFLLSKKYNKPVVCEAFKFLSITLLYVYALFEIVNSKLGTLGQSTQYIISILFFIYALNFKFISKSNNYKKLFSIASDIIVWFGAFWLIWITDLSNDSLSHIFSFGYEELFPVLNLRLIAYSFLGANIYYNIKIKDNEWQKYLAVILGFLYVHFESVNTAHYYNIEWLISVMWILYSGTVSLLGIFKNKKFLKITGIWLVILAISRIFIYDLANVDLIYKLIGFVVLGIVLILISYFYNKKN